MSLPKPPVTIISPFVDRRHGTERALAEVIDRLARDREIHLYAWRVADLAAMHQIRWHRVPEPKLPHLLKYLSFFTLNTLMRRRDVRRGLVSSHHMSPGINCPDATFIAVQNVFAVSLEQVAWRYRPSARSAPQFPRLMHRQLYWRLICELEKRVYCDPRPTMTVSTSRMAADIDRLYGRPAKSMHVIPNGVDVDQFSPSRWRTLREEARAAFGVPADQMTILLIGNDWVKKGVPLLLEGLAQLANPNLGLLLRGRDDPRWLEQWVRRCGLEGRVRLLERPIPDPALLYAAADMYVAPSLEDGFAMPVLEAMACGLPVIVSEKAGVSELLEHGEDALILRDPRDPDQLRSLLRDLLGDATLRQRLGGQGRETALRYSWPAITNRVAALVDGE